MKQMDGIAVRSKRMQFKTTGFVYAIRFFPVIIVLISNSAAASLCAYPHIRELSYNLNTRYDSLGNSFNNKSLVEFGLGGGVCLQGGSVGFEFTLIRPNNWGGNVSYKSNIFRSDNIPYDWSEGGRTFFPKNYINILSFNLLRELSIPKESIRFGIEGGLAWIMYSQAQMELNPGYDPYSDPDINWLYKLGTSYKYDKSHSRRSTIGISFRVKVEFLLSHHTGFELAAFTNINSIRSTAGLELHFIFGRLK